MDNFLKKPGVREWSEDMDLLSERDVQSKVKLFQHSLLVSSSIYAILISLHATPAQDQGTRWVFLVSIVLLAVSILLQLASLYDLLTLDERRRNRLQKESLERVARGEGYDRGRFEAGNRRISRFLQRCSIALFVLSILSLTYYTFLIYL